MNKKNDGFPLSDEDGVSACLVDELDARNLHGRNYEILSLLNVKIRELLDRFLDYFDLSDLKGLCNDKIVTNNLLLHLISDRVFKFTGVKV